MENWAEIRRLHRGEGMPIKAIARRLGISRNTVKRALASDEPPRYVRCPQGSAVDEFEFRIRELLAEFPEMPATVIAERVGWARSMSVFRARVAELRPLFAPRDPASRTSYAPGELAQCDLWFPPVDIPVGLGQVARLPVLTMTSGYSRLPGAVMIPTRQAEDLIAGHWHVFTSWGAVPRALVWDGESALSSRRAGKVKLSDQFEAFRGMLGVKVIICKPGDPEAKGLVERFNGYLETSFLPGRTFDSPADFNAQLSNWLTTKAVMRRHRTLGCRPIDRFDADKAAMLALPPVMPALGWHASTRLPRDHYVRIGSNDYSVDPVAIGRRIDVHADLTTVTIRWADRIVGVHERHWGKHQTIHDPAHVHAAKRMRMKPTRITSPAGDEVQIRALSDYDRLLDSDEVVA
jgi:transposase